MSWDAVIDRIRDGCGIEPYHVEEAALIYNADNRIILPLLEKGSVDLVLTDPPYAVPTVVAQGRNVTRNVGDLTIIEAGLGLFLSAAFRCLSPAGRAFIFCDGTSYPIIFRLLYGEFITALLVWDKGQIGMGREFRKSHELIIHGWHADTPIFSDGVGRPDILRCQPIPPEQRLHPAQKPIDLVVDILAVGGPLVLDPFLGSGTTAVAAKQLSRRCIGIEIEEKYCAIAVDRLRQEILPLEAPTPHVDSPLLPL